MSIPTKKTAKEISDMIIAQLETELNQNIPLLPKSFNRVLAKILGIVFVVLFQFAEFIALQIFISTASDKEFTIGGQKINPLNEWGNLIGLTRGDGERFKGVIDINVLTTGGTLQSGTRLIKPNTETVYLTVGATLLDASVVQATVRAIDYTSNANLDAGDTISFVSAPTAIEKDATVDSVTTVGADPEGTEDWRDRQLDWWASRPQGGAYSDYRIWGNEVDGVKQIYPFSGGTPAIPTSGAGQVDVYVEAEDTVDGIAAQPLLDSVKENIELTAATGLADRRQINAYVNVVSIYRTAFDAEISGLDVDDTAAAQALIETALINYFLDRENYIIGLSRLPRKDIISTAEVGGVVGRIAAAQGGVVATISLSESSVDFTSRVLVEGEKAKLGAITWL